MSYFLNALLTAVLVVLVWTIAAGVLAVFAVLMMRPRHPWTVAFTNTHTGECRYRGLYSSQAEAEEAAVLMAPAMPNTIVTAVPAAFGKD